MYIYFTINLATAKSVKKHKSIKTYLTFDNEDLSLQEFQTRANLESLFMLMSL